MFYDSKYWHFEWRKKKYYDALLNSWVDGTHSITWGINLILKKGEKNTLGVDALNDAKPVKCSSASPSYKI